jgi:hypothetical protein
VRPLPVIAEPLAVVGEHRHDRAVEDSLLLQVVEQDAEPVVGVGDLGGVARPVVALHGEREGGVVGRVRVEEMDPEEERSVAALTVDPGPGGGDRLRRASLGEMDAALGLAALGVLVVIEPRVEPESRVERRPADERRGPVPGVPQQLGERRETPPLAVGQASPQVVAETVAHRLEAREHAGVRGEGQRTRCRRGVEADPARREAIDPGRRARRSSEARDVVSPQRVHGDQDQVGRRVLAPEPEDEDGAAAEHEEDDGENRDLASHAP